MSRYLVHLYAGASLAVTVDVDDEGMTDEEVVEAATERALAQAPALCAHCAGGECAPWSLELGQWEPEVDSLTFKSVVRQDDSGLALSTPPTSDGAS